MSIKKPQFYTNTLKGESLSELFITKKDFNEWFNKLLSEGVEVRGTRTGNYALEWSEEEPLVDRGYTHKALLINIQPIKKESPSDVLRDWVNWEALGNPIRNNQNYAQILQRAKAALENEVE